MNEITHETFLAQYVLNQARTSPIMGINPTATVDDAERAWQLIQTIIQREKENL